MEWTAAHSERRDIVEAAWKAMPASLDRADYEAACTAIAVDPGGDHEVPMLVSFGEYDLSNDPTGAKAIQQGLAGRRLVAIKAEKAARRAAIAAPLADVPCPNCGALVSPSMLMSASLGTACPDCYDTLS